MKIYKCEKCDFETKYKNRMKSHANRITPCGIQIIQFKPNEKDEILDDDTDEDTDDNIDSNKKMLDELNELKSRLETKEQELTQRENDLKNKEKKISQSTQSVYMNLMKPNNPRPRFI